MMTMYYQFERMWISVRIQHSDKAVMIRTVYFPNDRVDKDKSESLIDELIGNIGILKAMGFKCLLFGDFNGIYTVMFQTSK